MESPIIVTGPPRSGTTWMQWLLSEHSRIHINGQEPKNGFKFWYEFLDQMIESGKWSKCSNKTKDVQDYSVLHYAGSNIDKCRKIWGKAFQDFMSGSSPKKPRWGCKFLWFCNNNTHVERFEQIWTDIKWVVCIRDPFVSFESQKNTFVKDMNLEVWLERWIDSVKFIRQHKNSFCFQ